MTWLLALIGTFFAWPAMAELLDRRGFGKPYVGAGGAMNDGSGPFLGLALILALVVTFGSGALFWWVASLT